VAKDLVARTRSGWFSDRCVCYLAAGKPGLLASETVEAAAALDETNRDCARHCRAAREIAL